MNLVELLDVVGNVAGIGALAVFVLLGYRVFQQSVTRSQEIDDKTISDLRRQLSDSASREEALRKRLDQVDTDLGSLKDEFEACKQELIAFRMYMRLNHDIDPDDITGHPA